MTSKARMLVYRHSTRLTVSSRVPPRPRARRRGWWRRSSSCGSTPCRWGRSRPETARRSRGTASRAAASTDSTPTTTSRVSEGEKSPG